VASPAVFSIAIHNSPASAVVTARRARRCSDSVSLHPTILVRHCLITRIDRGELRRNHFADKLAKSSYGLPAKFFANLIRATGQPCWFCRPIKRRIMLHVFLPWKGNYMKDASNKFVRAPNRARICVTRSARCGRRVSQGVLQSYPNLIEEVRVNGVKNIQP